MGRNNRDNRRSQADETEKLPAEQTGEGSNEGEAKEPQADETDQPDDSGSDDAGDGVAEPGDVKEPVGPADTDEAQAARIADAQADFGDIDDELLKPIGYQPRQPDPKLLDVLAAALSNPSTSFADSNTLHSVDMRLRELKVLLGKIKLDSAPAIEALLRGIEQAL